MDRVEKPWGNYEVLHQEDGFQVKRIEVSPGERLSLQTHAKRAEKWTIVAGKGLVTLDDEEMDVQPGNVISVDVGAKHRISNIGSSPLIFIEVQLGGYLGEDDIVRHQDDYDRK
jgi:mannose-6-phosphate isomerase-like protein (cupin superfamily)